MSGCSPTCQPKIPSSTPGAPGKNAYTFLTASFTMPAAGNFVTVTVSNAGQFGNRWAVVGQIVFVENAGHFQVEEVIGTNQLKITNIDYAGNATGGSTIASGGYISPAGLRGIQGIAGTNGTAGTARLYELLTDQTTPTLFSWTALATYSLPSNTLVNNGDSIVINATMRQFGSTSLDSSRRIFFAGTSVTIDGGFEPRTIGNSSYSLQSRVEIIKKSATEALIRNYHDTSIISSQYVCYETALSGLDFTIANNIIFSTFQSTANCFTLKSLTIDKITS